MAEAMRKKAYHVADGEKEMYTVDANNAVALHPDEWSFKPWSVADRNAANERRKQEHAKRVAEAKEFKLEIPPPLPPDPPEPTAAEKAEMSADEKARAEALAFVKAAEEKAAKEKVEADKLAAAKALLESPPPQPDPNARRPLFGAAKALVEAKAKRDAEAIKVKTDAEAAAAAALVNPT